MDKRSEKERLRESIKERLKKMNAQERETESRSLCRRVMELLPPGPLHVCAFMPMPSEANIEPLLRELLARGDSVYIPRFERGAFTYRRVEDLSTLQKGSLNVLEPSSDADEVDPAQISIALIPGIAFDAHGNRLGRGNGGFDRWLSTKHAFPVWGIAFDAQIVRDVPVEPHDKTVDAVITARGLVSDPESSRGGSSTPQ